LGCWAALERLDLVERGHRIAKLMFSGLWPMRRAKQDPPGLSGGCWKHLIDSGANTTEPCSPYPETNPLERCRFHARYHEWIIRRSAVATGRRSIIGITRRHSLRCRSRRAIEIHPDRIALCRSSRHKGHEQGEAGKVRQLPVVPAHRMAPAVLPGLAARVGCMRQVP
jgi:hypothetical protein